MKKVLALMLVLCMLFGLAACGGQNNAAPGNEDNTSNNSNNSNTETGPVADKSYIIRIYSNTNSPERTVWLTDQARQAGFNISIDDNSVVSGDTGAIQAAEEKKDGDILFGLNETRWGQITKGAYENIKLVKWTPLWADKVGRFKYDGLAYGLVIQNVLMLYRTDEYGTNGAELSFKHWSDIVDCGYTWFRQGRIGGTTNANINYSILYAFTDPSSPAGGISVDGWKTLWRYCAEGRFVDIDGYGFEPLNQGEVQVSSYFSSRLLNKMETAAENSEHPLTSDNCRIVDIEDGTYYIAEYIGVLDKEGRTPEQTLQVLEFAEWFGSAGFQAAWAKEFDTYPCNQEAASLAYSEKPEIYSVRNFALDKVPGTDMSYAEYVGEHSAEWTNILVNLGFYWKDETPPAEPDWDHLDWTALTQKAQ